MNRIISLICFILVTYICYGQGNVSEKECTVCKGSGENPNYCRSCKGTGIGYKFIPEMCRACAGGNKHCSVCKGSGKYGIRRVKVVCPTCNGKSTDKCPDSMGSGNVTIEKDDSLIGKCSSCKGKGTIEKLCPACGGTGNSAFSEYRMKHDIDYWVCRACQGYGKRYDKCPECKAFNNDVTVIISK